jgi:hypothetical protein
MFRLSVIAGHASGIQVQCFIQRQLQDNCRLRRHCEELVSTCEELESLLRRKEEDLSFISGHVLYTMADNTSLSSANEMLFRDNRHDVGVQCSDGSLPLQTAAQASRKMRLRGATPTNTATRSRAAQTDNEQRIVLKNKDTQTKTATKKAGVQCSLGYDTQTNTATATARVQCSLGFESLQLQPGRLFRGDWVD